MRPWCEDKKEIIRVLKSTNSLSRTHTHTHKPQFHNSASVRNPECSSVCGRRRDEPQRRLLFTRRIHLESAQLHWLATNQATVWNMNVVDKQGKLFFFFNYSIFNSTNDSVKGDEERLVNKAWAARRWGTNTLTPAAGQRAESRRTLDQQGATQRFKLTKKEKIKNKKNLLLGTGLSNNCFVLFFLFLNCNEALNFHRDSTVINRILICIFKILLFLHFKTARCALHLISLLFICPNNKNNNT